MPCVFQQDGVLTRTGYLVQINCQMTWTWSGVFWPPYCPDLNLDYYVRSIVKKVTDKTRHPNVARLSDAIEAAFRNMNIISAFKRFENENGYIESNFILVRCQNYSVKEFPASFKFSVNKFAIKICQDLRVAPEYSLSILK